MEGLPAVAAKFVSIITTAELEYGIHLAEAAGSRRLSEYRARLSVVQRYTTLDITRHTGKAYADLKAALAAHMQSRRGKKMGRWIEDWILLGSGKRLGIDENDLWIAAQGKERDLTIITGDDDMRILESVDPEVQVLLTRK